LLATANEVTEEAEEDVTEETSLEARMAMEAQGNGAI